MSTTADLAIAQAYLGLAGDLALRAANIASAVSVDSSSKNSAEEIEQLGDKVADLLKEYCS